MDVLRFMASGAKDAKGSGEPKTLTEYHDRALSTKVCQFPNLETVERDYAEDITHHRVARPPGYCAETLLHFGGLGVVTILDYGATCSGMPEEIAMAILDHAQMQVARGQYSEQDLRYPVARIIRFAEPPRIDGVAANSGIEIKYAMELRAEFVPVGKTKGPMQTLYFKIFPKGTCNVAGCILGFPVLDSVPHGLGHRVSETVHTFEGLHANLPRLDMAGRDRYTKALEVHRETGGRTFWMRERGWLRGLTRQKEPGKGRRLGDAIAESGTSVDVESGESRGVGRPCLADTAGGGGVPKESVSLEPPCLVDTAGGRGDGRTVVAVADAGPVLLAAGSSALVPAVWDGEVPDEDFWIAPLSVGEEPAGLVVAEGLCPGGEPEVLLLVTNESEFDVTIEIGRALAQLAVKPSEESEQTEVQPVLGPGCYFPSKKEGVHSECDVGVEGSADEDRDRVGVSCSVGLPDAKFELLNGKNRGLDEVRDSCEGALPVLVAFAEQGALMEDESVYVGLAARKGPEKGRVLKLPAEETAREFEAVAVKVRDSLGDRAWWTALAAGKYESVVRALEPEVASGDASLLLSSDVRLLA